MQETDTTQNTKCWIVACPMCDAEPGKPCRYVNPYPDRQGQQPEPWMSKSMQHHLSIAGKVMKMVHYKRYDLAMERIRAQNNLLARIERDRIAMMVPTATQELMAAGQALRQFDIREFNMLREFFIRYGTILQKE